MILHIHLSILFSYITFFHLISITFAQSENYIIQMNLSAMPKPLTNHHTWYQSTLYSALQNSQFTTTTNNLNSLISSKFIYTYTHVMNGFSANLSPKEHELLKTSPGYISSIPDLPVKLDTTYSPQFLGLNPNKGAWHDSNFGNDVIVGLIDTGVWPESDSFKDHGMTEVPSKWKGQCENSIHFNKSLCNKKLIGAKFFNKGLLAQNPNASLGLNSTRDTEGHGTHTSSTAAGSRVDKASFFGYAAGTASGIASNSRVAMYKAIWVDGRLSSDIIAAIDAAISDGVDVLSLSFGNNDVSLYEDPVAIATFAAMEKGVFVTTSAGNEGPAHRTIHNGTPWVITVAAGTMNRDFQGTLTLGNGSKIVGLSLYIGKFPSNNFPIVFMGSCDNVRELKKVKNKIVVCEDKNGTSVYDQLRNLVEAKSFGGVLISNVSDASFTQNFAFIVVNPINGEIVKAYIKSHNYNSKKSSSIANLSFKKTVFGTKPAPSVDSYSSRGPSKSCPFVLKPDITAPGTSILAAWPSNVLVSYLGTNEAFSSFNMISGTSMACPHVAGIAALLKGAHRDWSPAAIRSAIMTTSDIFDNTKEHIKDIDDNKDATPLALGAGHVNPNRALDPGLVYDVGVQDYVNLLCALNFTQQNITAITGSSFNDCSKPSLDLNYPSFIAFFNGGNSSKTLHEFHRTVSNVGEGKTIYTASITPIKGFSVSVIPNKLVFHEKNEKLSFKLRIEVERMAKLKKVSFGYLSWMDVKHVVRSPIVVTTMKMNS
ncbi:hypothetical protein RYX36_024231 [Vicia faba]